MNGLSRPATANTQKNTRAQQPGYGFPKCKGTEAVRTAGYGLRKPQGHSIDLE